MKITVDVQGFPPEKKIEVHIVSRRTNGGVVEAVRPGQTVDIPPDTYSVTTWEDKFSEIRGRVVHVGQQGIGQYRKLELTPEMTINKIIVRPTDFTTA